MLLCASVSSANDEFPKGGYLQLVLALHIWVLLQPLERTNLEFFLRDMLGTACISRNGTGELRQLSPLIVLMRDEFDLSESEYLMPAPCKNTLETLPPSEGVLNPMGMTFPYSSVTISKLRTAQCFEMGQLFFIILKTAFSVHGTFEPEVKH